jgi:hypothetical protein
MIALNAATTTMGCRPERQVGDFAVPIPVPGSPMPVARGYSGSDLKVTPRLVWASCLPVSAVDDICFRPGSRGDVHEPTARSPRVAREA